MKKDIQELVPEEYRDLVEVTPGKSLKGNFMNAMFVGAFFAAILCLVVPASSIVWLTAGCYLAMRITASFANRSTDKAEAKLAEKGFAWKE